MNSLKKRNKLIKIWPKTNVRHNILFLGFVLMLFSSRVNSQDCNSDGFDRNVAKKIINQQFGTLITQDSKTNIGNYAGLSIKDAQLNFNGNIVFKNGSVLGIKASGEVIDGFIPIFSNNKLNTDFGIDIQYNILDMRNKIQYETVQCRKYYDELRRIDHDYQLKYIEIKLNSKETLLCLEIEKEILKLRKIADKKDPSDYQRDSLAIEVEKISENIKYKKLQIAELPSDSTQVAELDQWRDAQQLKAKDAIVIDGFKFGWWTVGYSFSNSEFRLYDQAQNLENQVLKKTYDTHKVNVQYSYYQNVSFPFESFFLAGGIKYALENNLALLDKVDITETSTSGTPPVTRSKTAKYNAYEGEYKKDLNSISLYVDFYWFLFEGNLLAIHLFPEQKITDDLKPSTNFALGVLLPFKNKEKTENTINIELYANLLDLANNVKSEYDLFERSSYGLRFTFPINFNIKD